MGKIEYLIKKEIGQNNLLIEDWPKIIKRVNNKMERDNNFFNLEIKAGVGNISDSIVISLNRLVQENDEAIMERFEGARQVAMNMTDPEAMLNYFKKELLNNTEGVGEQEKECSVLINLNQYCYREDMFYGTILKMNFEAIEECIKKNEIAEAKPHLEELKKALVIEMENALLKRVDNLILKYEQNKVEKKFTRRDILVKERNIDNGVSSNIVKLSKKDEDGEYFISSADVLGKIMGKKIVEMKDEESLKILYEKIGELDLEKVVLLEKVKLVIMDSVNIFALENFSFEYYDKLWNKFNDIYELEKSNKEIVVENGVNLLLKAFLIGAVEKKNVETENTEKLLEMISYDIKKDILNKSSWLNQKKEKSLDVLLDFGVSKISSVIELIGASLTNYSIFNEKRMKMK